MKKAGAAGLEKVHIKARRVFNRSGENKKTKREWLFVFLRLVLSSSKKRIISTYKIYIVKF
ncbi:MAG TPA: hypothetical protein DC017_17285 [Candidatus Wallbacteria bacterium]|nr:hypothetical protein [Candidatus Wallbacteria bacterium]